MVPLMVLEAIVAVVAIILIEGRKNMVLRSRLALGVLQMFHLVLASLNQVRLPSTFATQDATRDPVVGVFLFHVSLGKLNIGTICSYV